MAKQMDLENIKTAILEVKGIQYHINAGQFFVIGRKHKICTPFDIAIDDESIDDCHAFIFVHGCNGYIADYGSRCGTFLNGDKVKRDATKLENVNDIKFGIIEAKLKFIGVREVCDSSGYDDEAKNLSDVICSSPEVSQRKHLLFKSNEEINSKSNTDCNLICDEDSFTVPETQFNNINDLDQNDSFCIPETQYMQVNNIDEVGITQKFDEINDADNSEFRIDTQEYNRFSGNYDINDSMDEAMFSSILPHMQNKKDELKTTVDLPDNVKESLNDEIEISSIKWNENTLKTQQNNERDNSCTPDIFDSDIINKMQSTSTQLKNCDEVEANENLLVDQNSLLTQRFPGVTYEEHKNLNTKSLLPTELDLNEMETTESKLINQDLLLPTQQFLDAKNEENNNLTSKSAGIQDVLPIEQLNDNINLTLSEKENKQPAHALPTSNILEATQIFNTTKELNVTNAVSCNKEDIANQSTTQLVKMKYKNKKDATKRRSSKTNISIDNSYEELLKVLNTSATTKISKHLSKRKPSNGAVDETEIAENKIVTNNVNKAKTKNNSINETNNNTSDIESCMSKTENIKSINTEACNNITSKTQLLNSTPITNHVEHSFSEFETNTANNKVKSRSTKVSKSKSPIKKAVNDKSTSNTKTRAHKKSNKSSKLPTLTINKSTDLSSENVTSDTENEISLGLKSKKSIKNTIKTLVKEPVATHRQRGRKSSKENINCSTNSVESEYIAAASSSNNKGNCLQSDMLLRTKQRPDSRSKHIESFEVNSTTNDILIPTQPFTSTAQQDNNSLPTTTNGKQTPSSLVSMNFLEATQIFHSTNLSNTTMMADENMGNIPMVSTPIFLKTKYKKNLGVTKTESPKTDATVDNYSYTNYDEWFKIVNAPKKCDDFKYLFEPSVTNNNINDNEKDTVKNIDFSKQELSSTVLGNKHVTQPEAASVINNAIAYVDKDVRSSLPAHSKSFISDRSTTDITDSTLTLSTKSKTKKTYKRRRTLSSTLKSDSNDDLSNTANKKARKQEKVRSDSKNSHGKKRGRKPAINEASEQSKQDNLSSTNCNEDLISISKIRSSSRISAESFESKAAHDKKRDGKPNKKAKSEISKQNNQCSTSNTDCNEDLINKSENKCSRVKKRGRPKKKVESEIERSDSNSSRSKNLDRKRKIDKETYLKNESKNFADSSNQKEINNQATSEEKLKKRRKSVNNVEIDKNLNSELPQLLEKCENKRPSSSHIKAAEENDNDSTSSRKSYKRIKAGKATSVSRAAEESNKTKSKPYSSDAGVKLNETKTSNKIKINEQILPMRRTTRLSSRNQNLEHEFYEAQTHSKSADEMIKKKINLCIEPTISSSPCYDEVISNSGKNLNTNVDCNTSVAYMNSMEKKLPRRTTRAMSKDENELTNQKSTSESSIDKVFQIQRKTLKKSHEKSESSKILVSFSTIDATVIEKLMQNKLKKILKIADHAKHCDVLIMDTGSRTIKFLIAMARGIPIVTTEWLAKKSAKVSALQECILIDKAFEKRFNFSLVNSLHRALTRKLLEGYEFAMTENILPQPNEMEDLLKCSGATVHTNLSSLKNNLKKEKNLKIYLITSNRDKSVWNQYYEINANICLINAEGVIDAVVHQDVKYLQIHALKTTSDF